MKTKQKLEYGQPLVSLKRCSVSLEGRTILHELDWALKKGESWAVMGPNGSGKSTFLKLIRGDLWPSPGQENTRCYWEGVHASESPVDWRDRVAYVSPEQQERVLRQEWALPVQYVVLTGFFRGDYTYGKVSSLQRKKAREWMEKLDVYPLRNRNIQALSTGELRRVLIARALVCDPKCLFLDEFVDGLDPSARAKMLQTLDRIIRKGIQLIYTTHRRDELIPSLTHMLELQEGRIVRAQSRHDERNWSGPPGFSHGPEFRRSGGVPPPASARMPPLLPHFSLRDDGGSPDSLPFLIRIRNADVYLDATHALQKINWTIKPREHWAVLGHNGAGKSTLLKLVFGHLYCAKDGSVERFNGEPFTTIWALREKIGYVSFDLQTHYLDEITGREVVASGIFSTVGLMESPSRAQWRQVDEVMRLFQAQDLASKRVGHMSFGQMRKLILLRALVKQPRILVLDEPFDGLDEGSRLSLSDILKHAAVSGTTLIIVTHHPDELPACMTHWLRLEKGRIEAVGVFDVSQT